VFKTTIQNTSDILVNVDEFWARKESNKDESTVRPLEAKVHVDVGKTQQNWMRTTISSHD
jgi:hypothetical protein